MAMFYKGNEVQSVTISYLRLYPEVSIVVRQGGKNRTIDGELSRPSLSHLEQDIKRLIDKDAKPNNEQ